MPASVRALWRRLGRVITGLTLACFFLPFFGVSCEGTELVSISGADLVGGCRPGGLAAQVEDGVHGPGVASGDELPGGMTLDRVPRQGLALVALVLAVGMFGLSWTRRRGAMVGALALSLACLGVLAVLHHRFGVALDRAVAEAIARDGERDGGGAGMLRELRVDAGARFGLWCVCLGLLATASLCGAALRGPRDPCDPCDPCDSDSEPAPSP